MIEDVDEFFIVDNKPVVLYIRDQIVNIQNYERGKFGKFHLCFCDELKSCQSNDIQSLVHCHDADDGRFNFNIEEFFQFVRQKIGS